MQWATCGRRRRKTDPLYTIRKRLLTGEEKLAPPAVQRIHDALQLGDTSGETMLAWRVKEAIRDLYQQVDEHAARKHVTKIITICAKRSSPPELQSLARTITQWQEEILAYINHHYSNGITEGMNNHIKKIKRNGYGYRNFNNYRLRILLALGGVHTNILKTILIP